jgi:putative ABC transport system permease protein
MKSLRLRLLLSSLRVGRSRAVLALGALLVGATLAAALLDLSFDLRAKMSRELRSYGANLLVLPREGEALDEQAATNAVTRIPSREAVAAWTPALVGVATIDVYDAVPAHPPTQREVAVVGVDMDRWRQLNPSLRIDGPRVLLPDSAIVGTRLAEQLGPRPGGDIELRCANRMDRLHITATVESGGEEDLQVFVPLAHAQTLLAQPRRISALQVAALGGLPGVVRVGDELSRSMPNAVSHPLRQVAASQGTFLDHVTRLMALFAAFVIVVCGLCVMTTMFNQVTERQKEIGLMKALGADNRQVAGLFMSEALLLGALAALGGVPLGIVLARALGQQLFAATVSLRLVVLPAVALLSCGLAVAAQILPLRRAMAIAPAVTLRGE